MLSNEINYSNCFEILKNKFKKNNRSNAFKKYIYVNIWSLGCEPCINELPFLDSLHNYLVKDMDYIFVSSHSNAAVDSFLMKNNISVSNFIFINEMNDFIKLVFDEIKLNGMAFPTHLIMSENGDILAFYCGSINSKMEALPIINFINNLT